MASTIAKQCQNMLRLTGVAGSACVAGNAEQIIRRNNMLFVGKTDELAEPIKQHVVFFPGDVQNYKSQMTSPVNRKSSEWCYENTAGILANQFKHSWIWIIEPAFMHDHIFSRYDNFVQGNLLGAPESFDNYGALHYLQELLKAGVDLVNNHLEGENPDQVTRLDGTSADQCSTSASQDQYHVKLDLPLVLVGFSKGCIVLNQFLHELADAEATPKLQDFVHKIVAWYWLDGGHSKESNTWITDEDVLKDLAGLKTKINVHVTPYQIRDSNRPHIGEEERIFVDTLKTMGADVTENLHFDGFERSLKNHFRVLENIFVTTVDQIKFQAAYVKK